MKNVTTQSRCRINGIKKKCVSPIYVKPTVKRYFFVCPQNIALMETPYILEAGQFVNDHGNAVVAFRTFGSSGYTNLYINGVMQGSALYQVNSKSLALNPTGEMIYEGTPIIIEAIGFKLLKKKR